MRNLKAKAPADLAKASVSKALYYHTPADRGDGEYEATWGPLCGLPARQLAPGRCSLAGAASGGGAEEDRCTFEEGTSIRRAGPTWADSREDSEKLREKYKLVKGVSGLKCLFFIIFLKIIFVPTFNAIANISLYLKKNSKSSFFGSISGFIFDSNFDGLVNVHLCQLCI